MRDSIRYIYEDNVSEYKDLCASLAEKQSAPTRGNINSLRFRYHIIYHMYLRYGCIECEKHSCNCCVLPNKHWLVTDGFHEGLPPWLRQKHQV